VAYLKTKTIGYRTYYYVVESARRGAKVDKKILEYLGPSPDAARLRRALRYWQVGKPGQGGSSVSIPDYGKHLKGLRAAYVQATPRQRAKVALDRMKHPDAGPNLLIAIVSAVEALARALALDIEIAKGIGPRPAYGNLRNRGPIDLLSGVVAPARSTTMPGLVGAECWEEFKWAVQYRNLLIHEGTFLRAGYCNRLLDATRKVFGALEKMS
jgi:hypothetical protein